MLRYSRADAQGSVDDTKMSKRAVAVEVLDDRAARASDRLAARPRCATSSNRPGSSSDAKSVRRQSPAFRHAVRVTPERHRRDIEQPLHFEVVRLPREVLQEVLHRPFGAGACADAGPARESGRCSSRRGDCSMQFSSSPRRRWATPIVASSGASASRKPGSADLPLRAQWRRPLRIPRRRDPSWPTYDQSWPSDRCVHAISVVA